MTIPRFDYHNHTDMSNIRVIDAINRPKELIDKAISIGLAGIAISEHEHLGNSITIDKLQQEYKKSHPNFKIVHANEIYLTDTRDMGQIYYHFILIALDRAGFDMLTRLSSSAWLQGYYDRGLMRVPTLKTEVEDIIRQYGQGHIYASTACLGSELDRLILEMVKAENAGNMSYRGEIHDKIVSFISWCVDTFGKENFSLEVQPAKSDEQLAVNTVMPKIAKVFGLPICITSDAHFLNKEDRAVHKAFLNSKEAEREVDSFYYYCWLHNEEEILDAIKDTPLNYEECCVNSMKILDRVQDYSLQRLQEIPLAPVPPFDKDKALSNNLEAYPTLSKMAISNSEQERAWVNLCYQALQDKGLVNSTYLSRLEEEADTQSVIGKKLNTCIFAYPLFMRHYINLIWDCGSTVGTGRGCFVPQSQVLLSTGRTKAIQDIKEGDEIYSGHGEIHPVLKVFNYDVEETLFTIQAETISSFSTTCTNNHKFLAIHNNECHQDRSYCSPLKCAYQACPDRASFTPQWVEAQDLKVGDWLFYPRVKFKKKDTIYLDLAEYIRHGKDNQHYQVLDDKIIPTDNVKRKNIPLRRFIPIDKDFLYFLGVFVGDGWTKYGDYNTSFGIAFNSSTSKDLESLKRVESYLRSMGLLPARRKHKTKNLIQLICYSAPWWELLEQNVKHGALNKEIPKWALYDDKDEMLSLLKGLLASDGNYDSKVLRFSYDSISLSLISQIKTICSYLGLYGSIAYRKANGPNKASYKLRVNGAQLNQYLSYFPLLKQTPSQVQKGIIVTEDGFYFKIKNIITQNYKGKVYDLMVDKDHSYIINNMAVHNSAGGGLSHWLLGITQTNPIETKSYFWRFLNKDRLELPDIDVDVCPSKREKILDETRKETGELGCVHVCTYGVLSTKAAIKCAARGYRSQDYPNGISLEDAEYLSSLVPSERGFLYSLHDLFYGNEEKNRKPNQKFISEISRYDGLKDILLKIEGLVVQAGIHASGVIYPPKTDYYRYGAFMRAKNGMIVTQYSLHDSEAAGATKVDWLVTEVQDVITQCILELQKAGYIESEFTLRQAYDKYLAPEKLPLQDDKLWNEIDKAEILKLFQLDSQVGRQGTKLIKPRNVEELTAVNALIRLMSDDDEESAMERYVRLKNHPEQWQKEMDTFGLTKNEQRAIRTHLGESYGVGYSQEQLMLVLMDKDICGFSMKEANAARKLISKKKMDQIPILRQEVNEKASSPALGKYVWNFIVKPQLGYSFARVHGYSYSLIGCQCAYLATYFPRVYWNCACLRVDSGLEEDASSDYTKIAKAVGNMVNYGIKVLPIDINKSQYMFEPDEEKNAILYGMKALNGVGGDIIQTIVSNRPYSSLQDFLDKTNTNKTATLSLIKSGAFDSFGERREIMKDYLRKMSNPKKRITLQNFKSLVDANLLPESLDFQRRLFVFNKMLKVNKKVGDWYCINYNYYDFYEQFFDVNLLEAREGTTMIAAKTWDKLYKKGMEPARRYFQEHQQEILDALNDSLLQEQWDRYCGNGSYSAWEMNSMGYYYHEHELAHANFQMFDIKRYKDLPREPDVEYTFRRNGRDIPIFKTVRICGTVVGKDNIKTSINLLTLESGVVTVKINRDYYAKYNRRISEPDENGVNKIREAGWFEKGNLVVVNGFRRGDTFVMKAYKKTPSHQLYLIDSISNSGILNMRNTRYGEEEVDA